MKNECVRTRDLRALRALLDCEHLDEAAENAIPSMLQALESRGQRELTVKQRAWVDDLVQRYDLAADVDPPTPLTHAQAAEAKRLGPMQLNAGPMALRPPGARR